VIFYSCIHKCNMWHLTLIAVDGGSCFIFPVGLLSEEEANNSRRVELRWVEVKRHKCMAGDYCGG